MFEAAAAAVEYLEAPALLATQKAVFGSALAAVCKGIRQAVMFGRVRMRDGKEEEEEKEEQEEEIE